MKEKKSGLSDDDANSLAALVDLLDAHSKGKSLERYHAAAYRDVLRRVLNPTQPQYTQKQRIQMKVAICYHIRMKLKQMKLIGKKVRPLQDTATAHGASDGSVRIYASRWREYAKFHIESLLHGRVGTEGRRAEELMRYELEVFEGKKINKPGTKLLRK